MKYCLFVASENEKDLFYSSPEEYDDEERGLIGHLRGDFGSGTKFFTSFWDRDICAELKTQDFKDELDKVVNAFRKPGKVLCNLQDMIAYCDYCPSSKLEGLYSLVSYGFKVEGEKHCYYFRCIPHKGNYNFYIYCYLRERMLDSLKRLEEQKNNNEE